MSTVSTISEICNFLLSDRHYRDVMGGSRVLAQALKSKTIDDDVPVYHDVAVKDYAADFWNSPMLMEALVRSVNENITMEYANAALMHIPYASDDQLMSIVAASLSITQSVCAELTLQLQKEWNGRAELTPEHFMRGSQASGPTKNDPPEITIDRVISMINALSGR